MSDSPSRGSSGSSVSSSAATPFERLGGEATVRALVERFYDAMDDHEPELAALHPLEAGKVSRVSRDRFALFLIGWLGGPQEYMRLHGHPRLRMRHAHVPVTVAMREAWLRSMRVALEDPSVGADSRVFLEQKLSELADFLRNQPG
ncbi:MAG TPA: cyanoglobin [Polyangiaceae bacterium]|nr:cyanoglobin [Polyangiaceae bacterium]